MRGYRLLFILISISFCSTAQQALLAPEDFLLFYRRMSFINPAITDSSDFFASLGYRQYTGPLSKVNSFYFNTALKVGKDNNHSIGIGLENKTEGPYIDRPGILVIYSYTLPLGNESFLTAGINGGLKGYYFNSPSATGSASFTVFDVNAGIALKLRNISIAAGVNQAPDMVARARIAEFRYPRFFNFSYAINKALSPDIYFHNYFMLTTAPESLSKANFMADLSYQNLISAGIGFKTYSGLFIYGSFGNLEVGRNTFSFTLAYNTGSFSKRSLISNILEFGLAVRR